jgi:hypothetical protein
LCFTLMSEKLPMQCGYVSPLNSILTY